MTTIKNQGETLDCSLEHEIMAPAGSLGFKVSIKYKQSSRFGPITMVKRNATEVHWKFPHQLDAEEVAIESDIHKTGQTIFIDQIESLSIELETIQARAFHMDNESQL